MGYFGFYIISAVAMVLCLGISWVVTGLLHLSSQAESIVRMLLMGLVFAGFGALFYFRQRKESRSATDAERAPKTPPLRKRKLDFSCATRSIAWLLPVSARKPA